MSAPSQQYGGGQRSEQMVSLFRERTSMYKVGLLGLVLCCIIFIIGFSTPHWIKAKDDYSMRMWLTAEDYDLPDNVHFGLWNAPCMSLRNGCNTGLTIAQVVFCLHLAGYVLSLGVAMHENYRRVNPATYHSRRLELCVLATGILGTAGMVAFGVWYSNSITHSGYQWSLALSSISLTGLYIVFFLLLCGNRKPFIPAVGTVVTQQAPGVVYYHPGHPYGPTVVQTYGPMQPGYPQHHGPQSQPLLPPHGYPYPSTGRPQGPPPAYSLPPAYPNAPQPVPGPAYGLQPVLQQEAYAKANAPPSEEDTLPMKG